MKILAGFLFAAVLTLLAADTFSIFGLTWTVPSAPDWKIDDEGGFPTLHLLTGREPRRLGIV